MQAQGYTTELAELQLHLRQYLPWCPFELAFGALWNAHYRLTVCIEPRGFVLKADDYQQMTVCAGTDELVRSIQRYFI